MTRSWQDSVVSVENISEHQYEIVVVGSGMGGAMAALALCKAGIRVLLIEKGHSFLEQTKLEGIEVEQNAAENRLKQGRWPVKLSSKVDGFKSDFYAPLGCGLGGSTLIYGGALERFSPQDFDSRLMPSGETLQWPYSYGEIEPYYQWAESLLNVHGTVDELEVGTNYQLKTPPTLNATDSYFQALFRKCGLHPYHLHVAVGQAENTRNRDNVLGSLEGGVIPALQTGNLLVSADCEVSALHADGNQVLSIELNQKGSTVKIPVADKRVVLACGAYFTPALLLKSANDHWPAGLGNQQGLVGRYLMFHTSDYIGINTRQRLRCKADKTLGLRDFYCVDGEKLGQLQSTGKSAEVGYILYFLRQKLATSVFGKIPLLNKLLHQLMRIPAYAASILFREVSIFSSIVEDFPYKENRVELDLGTASGVRLVYSISGELRRRTERFRSLLKRSIKGHWVVTFSQGIELNFGHPCGTCRAGTDPTTSVVSGTGKVHGLENLYIADGSFMPSSGGTNPSLTIAAHSLRVGESLAKEVERSNHDRRSQTSRNQ